jgi:hypothetical protein
LRLAAPHPALAGTIEEKNMFAHPTCVWWKGLSILIAIPISISMRYFLRLCWSPEKNWLAGSSFNHQRSCKLLLSSVLLSSDTRPCRANISSKSKSKSQSGSNPDGSVPLPPPGGRGDYTSLLPGEVSEQSETPGRCPEGADEGNSTNSLQAKYLNRSDARACRRTTRTAHLYGGGVFDFDPDFDFDFDWSLLRCAQGGNGRTG